MENISENYLHKKSYAPGFAGFPCFGDLDQDSGDEPQKRFLARKEPDDSRALLDLAVDIIEFAILGKVDALGTVITEPFLKYARRLLLERTKTMTGEAAGVASSILGRHGTKEDEALFEWVLKKRPYVASDLTKVLKNLRARLAPQAETRPERREIRSSSPGGDARTAESVTDHPQDKGSATSRAKPWLFGGIILVVLLGLYRFVRLRPRAPSS